jgi:hypothetical protein
MATLDPGNIVNGNVIEPSDLLQLYQAFGTGSGTSITGLAMTGSLHGTGSWSLSSSIAVSASNITTAVTGGGTHYLTFVDQAGTRPPKIASLLEYTPSNNTLQVTASYAANGGVANQLVEQGYSNIGVGPVEAIFKFYAGKVRIVSDTATTANFPGLAGKTLGTTVWVTATVQGDASSYTPPNLPIVLVKSLSGLGALTFETIDVPDTSEVHYHVIYVP